MNLGILELSDPPHRQQGCTKDIIKLIHVTSVVQP